MEMLKIAKISRNEVKSKEYEIEILQQSQCYTNTNSSSYKMKIA
jgi:hypothetical protein